MTEENRQDNIRLELEAAELCSAEARTLADLGQTHHKARAYSAGARRNQVDGPALGFA